MASAIKPCLREFLELRGMKRQQAICVKMRGHIKSCERYRLFLVRGYGNHSKHRQA
jgi:hypothetical protein